VVEGLGSHCQGGQKLEVVVKGGKVAAPAPVLAPAPAKKAPALAPRNSEAPTSVLGVPAPAPSPGPPQQPSEEPQRHGVVTAAIMIIESCHYYESTE